VAKSNISWTDYTFNPWLGCTKVSEGCRHCYAETLSIRFGQNVWGTSGERRRTSEMYWKKPLSWNRQAAAGGPSKVFCGSMCDWAEDRDELAAWRAELWQLIRQTPNLTWQLLTKRSHRIGQLLPTDWGDGWPNVWLGVSVESIGHGFRADELRRVPAVVRFISYEPALGPLDDLDLSGIHWVIYGGESGRGHREHDVAWPRAMRDKCRAEGVAFFYKQSPHLKPGQGAMLDGEFIQQFPGEVTV